MPLSVLITQCLQNDFVAPIPPLEPQPNKLHVGSAESLRLLGEDPRGGPVAQLMAWARAQGGERLHVVHIRDWHDPEAAAQAAHLDQFGRHCLRDTRGARFVLDLDDHTEDRPSEHIVDATGLNDMHETRLPEVLEALRCASPDGELRVGVVGVWTEAKITFLLYDLLTRAGVTDVSTCSALTASSSRQHHHEALAQLRRILGVRVHDTVGSFTSWLVPDGAEVALPKPPGSFEPPIALPPGAVLDPVDRELVGVLFRDATSVDLHPLSGGFSGALVFRASSRDAHGHQQAPSVVKIGPSRELGKERVRFERVENILGNTAPSVRAFVDLGERAAIKFSYAAMGQGAVRSFKALYEGGAPQQEVDRILQTVFDEVLQPFFAAAQPDRVSLFEEYQFAAKWAPSVAGHVEAVAGPGTGALDELSFPGGLTLPNVARFYDRFLPRGIGFHEDAHLMGWVHGDLNGANILLDGRDNVWLIDFAHTDRGHLLRDLAKLENDLLFIFTKLETEDALAPAIRLSQALRGVKDLREPLPESVDLGPSAPAGLHRAWATLRTLRGILARKCREDRSPLPLSIALLRYAAHTLSFDESSPLQKRWALAAACGHAQDVERTLLADRKLRVNEVGHDILGGAGRLGMTICPGRRDRARSLDADLDALVGWGASTLVSLLTERELLEVGVPELPAAARDKGLAHAMVPVPDQGVPTLEEARALVARIRGDLAAGRSVVVHCMGGLGRTGTIAACALVDAGLPAGAAIEAVRAARDRRAVESAVQERFVHAFEAARPTP